MDIYTIYKPLRNHLRKVSLEDSLYVVWAYIKHLTFNNQFPPDIEVSKAFLSMTDPRTVINPWQLELLTKEIIINSQENIRSKKNLREWRIKENSKSSLQKNVAIEIEYNIRLLTSTLTNINRCITEQVAVDNHNAYCNLNYDRFARYFIQSYYQSGFLSDKWNLRDLEKLDDILIYYGPSTDSYILNALRDWNNNTLTSEAILRKLTVERINLEKHIQDFSDLKEKLS